MATVPQTGPTALGEAISGGARDYTNRRRQLEDVADARAYDTQNYNRRRQDTLSDVQSARAYESQSLVDRLNLQAQQDITLGLVHEGILAPADINNPEAVAVAYEVARGRGLDKLYSDLLTAPGADGKPLLDRGSLNNPQAIEAAKAAWAQRQALTRRDQMEQPTNAAASIDALAAEGQQVRQQMNLVERKLSETAPRIDEQAVLARALALAREAKGGKAPSQQEIQAMLGQAQQEAQQVALQRWYQEKEDAKIQYQLLNGQLNNIRQQQTELTRTFQVAPRVSALAEPTQAPVTEAPPPATAEQRQAAFAEALRKAVPQDTLTAPRSRGGQLPNPINDPVVAAENQRRLGVQSKALADPYNDAMDELARVNGRLASAQAGVFDYIPTPGGMMVAQPLGGSVQAERISDLLIKQQAVQRDLETKRRAMLGLPADVTAPTISNSSGSVPAAYARPADWWKVGD